MRPLHPRVFLGTLGAISQVVGSEAFSWGGERVRGLQEPSVDEGILGYPASHHREARLPNIYAVAMNELQDLESEPLCHRMAARLLVNNCQVLDGKDEATILTDSGRQVRDFVDSYAASLAICDLERGSFAIPQSCTMFREDSLVAIPVSKKAHLHVSSHEIDTCLAGLAKSDSAWNTWVSYRHKSLRFCEAARSDNEKAQSVRLHKRLTEVLSRLTEGVEAELEKQANTFNVRVTESLRQFDDLDPRFNRLRDHLGFLEEVMRGDILQTVKLSAESARHGLEDAQSLQGLLSTLIQMVLDGNTATVAAHEQALETASQRTGQQLSGVMTALTAAVVSTTSLQDQMELSRLQAAEIANRQDQIEEGLGRLVAITEDLNDGHESHANMLNQMHEKADGIRETLDKASTSAVVVSGSLNSRSTWTSWWPYFICPTASLLLGSYGLPPSGARNLGLIALGELAGLVVSASRMLPYDVFTAFFSDIPPGTSSNQTLAFEDASNDFHHIVSTDIRARQAFVRA